MVLTGTAGLVAGAISMALGEYTSVRTQNEQVGAEVAKERRELERHPEAEAAELAERWVAPRAAAATWPAQVADALARDPDESAAGARPGGAGRRPRRASRARGWRPARRSSASRAGALVPLLPYLVGADVLWPALVAGGVGLFVAGALVARFTAPAVVAQRPAPTRPRRAGRSGRPTSSAP